MTSIFNCREDVPPFSLTFQPLTYLKVTFNVIPFFFIAKYYYRAQKTHLERKQNHYSTSLMCFTEVEATSKGPGRISCHPGLARMTSWLQTVHHFGAETPNTYYTEEAFTFWLPQTVCLTSIPSLQVMVFTCVCGFCFHSLSYTV